MLENGGGDLSRLVTDTRVHRDVFHDPAIFELEMERIFEITRTADCAEGIEAFLDKRAPVYHPGAPVDKRARWQDD